MNRRLVRRPVLASAALLALAAFAGAPECVDAARGSGSAAGDSALAVYDGGAVYPYEFARSWRGLMQDQRESDDLIAKKREFLRRVVDRELLAREAMARPFTMTARETLLYARTRAAYLQVSFLNRLRSQEPRPTDEDLALFTLQNRRLAEIRFITFADLESARSWRQRVLRGVPISVLDGAIREGGPNAPVAAPSRGVAAEQIPDTLATMIWKMHPGELSNIVYDGEKPAMIHVLSFPPRTSPVRLDDPNAVLAEFERRQMERVRRNYRNRLHEDLQVRYDTTNTAYLLDRYMKTVPDQSGFDPVQNLPTYRLTLPMPQMAFDDSVKLLAWTARGDTLRMGKYLNFWNEQPANSRPEVRSHAALEAMMDRVIFDDVLVERAIAAGLDRDPLVVAELARARESMALDHYYEAEVWNKVDMAPEKVKTYFASVPGHYDDVESVKPRIILVNRQSLADSVKAMAEAGQPFSTLAETYSEHGVSAAKGGALGVVTLGQNSTGNVALEQALFKSPVGKIGGPELTPDGWVVWIVDEKFPAKKRTLAEEDTRVAVERDFHVIEAEKLLNRLLAQLQSKSHVRYFDERMTKDLGADPDLGVQ